MSRDNTLISNASSYQEIGSFWEEHDLSDFREQTKPVKFDVDIQTQRIYYPIDSELSHKIEKVAGKHVITPEALINLWLYERIKQEKQTA